MQQHYTVTESEFAASCLSKDSNSKVKRCCCVKLQILSEQMDYHIHCRGASCRLMNFHQLWGFSEAKAPLLSEQSTHELVNCA